MQAAGAGRSGVAVGHEAGAALVARGHDTEVGQVGQAVEDQRVVGADDAEDGVDALGADGSGDGLAPSKTRHRMPPTLSGQRWWEDTMR